MTPARPAEQFETLVTGLKKKTGPDALRGPWFQYHDAVGFEWNTYEITIPDLPAELVGFRIVQLSDLHCQPHWQTAYDDLIDRLRIDEPDLLVITGDIVDYEKKPWLCVPTAKRLLKQLHAKHGVFGILGNHDFLLRLSSLRDTPIRLIDGQRVLVPARGQSIELIAPPGPLRENYPRGFEKTFPVKQAGIPRIILSHYPDHIRRMKRMRPDIFFAGHTHGGQACLPGGIAILRHDSLPLKLLKGAHRLYRTWCFVNRGFGFSTMNFRLFCPSEVIEIRLRK